MGNTAQRQECDSGSGQFDRKTPFFHSKIPVPAQQWLVSLFHGSSDSPNGLINPFFSYSFLTAASGSCEPVMYTFGALYYGRPVIVTDTVVALGLGVREDACCTITSEEKSTGS